MYDQKGKHPNSGKETTSVLLDRLLQHPDPLLERGFVLLQSSIFCLQQRDLLAIRLNPFSY